MIEVAPMLWRLRCRGKWGKEEEDLHVEGETEKAGTRRACFGNIVVGRNGLLWVSRKI
jgi:hypothetical protein